MSNNEAAKKFKVKSCFAYHEERTSDTEVSFGWIPMDKGRLEIPFVMSYGSKAKTVNEDDAKWSKDKPKLEALRESSNPNYRDGEGDFLLSLANLLKDGGKFTQYGRIFKLIKDNT